MLFFFYWILYLGTSALIWTTAQARPRSSHGVIKRELGHFEERYINTLNYKLHNETASIELRVYFPVAGALIEHQGSMIEANELGEFEIKDVDSDYVVLGRKQSGRVQGVQGNIIKDGIIYLADQAIQHTKSAILDHNHDHSHSKRSSGTCIENHGGENCSDAYNIHEGRCPENHQVCMDYNGYFTDCKKENKFLYFTGSDCYVSLSKGNCWNEIM
ncbi:hypothetical protein RhiirA5_389547 [Rhizophagus irregularis]|uniref:Uncharacterized protein n=1 Tax=Rhizophagus irregularis TaxID=588596 RepID=A0A2I1E8M1_9GLOM|nr:hypothetical protein RhiirA5_389547 [Rhizophagus irregularis]PKY18456.1 hypothetical protein RhiirB3_422278 [Rhizophagus irregularis]